MDTCIVLRTALIKDGTMYVQAGAGIVADSDPEFEQQECINKAKALFRAAEEANASPVRRAAGSRRGTRRPMRPRLAGFRRSERGPCQVPNQSGCSVIAITPQANISTQMVHNRSER